jgi:hypothetical protein
MSTRGGVIAVSLVLAFALSPKAVKALEPGERCDGLAIVWPPPNSANGSIYMSYEPRSEDKTLDRMGYLPSGTVVILEEPSRELKSRENYCRFRFRDALVGHIDSSHVKSLAKVLRSANLDETKAVINQSRNNISSKSKS